jgi:nucleotide-binding universal stress UspA family protein
MSSDALDTILCGVDGSDGSIRALRWATARANEANAELVAVHVLTYSHEFARDLSPSGLTTWRAKLETNLNGPWTQAARQDDAKVRCVLVEDDTTAEGILAAAETEHADLVVVGARSHGGLGARLLGSTSYTLTHRARQPVVVNTVDWTSTAPP